jgi:hypothetical protein
VKIWERRNELERQERAEREAALAPIHAKYEPIFAALQMECEATGHEWSFAAFGVVGQRFFACRFCRKTKVEE